MNPAFESDPALDAAGDEFTAFEDGAFDELDALDDEAGAFDEADVDTDLGDFADDAALFASADDAGDGYDALEDDADGLDAAAELAWSAFEDDIADSLDADGDEFLSRLLGGLTRAAGAVARHAGPAAQVAAQAQRAASSVARVASGTGQLANAAALAARWLGAPNAAAGLAQVARGAGRVSTAAQRTQRVAQRAATVLPNVRRGAQQVATGASQAQPAIAALIAQLGQLMGQQADEYEAFDAMVDLMTEDGIDEALPAAVGLAARAAARGLGWRNVGELSQAARRALVRGIATATRSLVRTGGPSAVRALPRITDTVSQRARQRRLPPPQAARAVAHSVPRAAQQVARQPQVMRRLIQPASRLGPAGRPRNVGFGVPASARGGVRRLQFPGPVELTIRPL